MGGVGGRPGAPVQRPGGGSWAEPGWDAIWSSLPLFSLCPHPPLFWWGCVTVRESERGRQTDTQTDTGRWRERRTEGSCFSCVSLLFSLGLTEIWSFLWASCMCVCVCTCVGGTRVWYMRWCVWHCVVCGMCSVQWFVWHAVWVSLAAACIQTGCPGGPPDCPQGSFLSSTSLLHPKTLRGPFFCTPVAWVHLFLSLS